MILAILQARMSSTRLPGKVMADLAGKPMILRQIERINRSQKIDQLLVATSLEASDDILAQLCESANINCYRGDLQDVLARFYHAATNFHSINDKPTHVVRLTADCPLTDPSVIDEVISLHLDGHYAYTTNAVPHTFPDGLDVEVMSYSALESAYQNAATATEREHVTPYLRQHTEQFANGSLTCPNDLSALRWTVDYPEDLQLVQRIFSSLYQQNPKFTYFDILTLLEQHPEWQQLNNAYVVT